MNREPMNCDLFEYRDDDEREERAVMNAVPSDWVDAEEPPRPEAEDHRAGDRGESEQARPAADEPQEDTIDNPYFTVLGHDRTHLFVYVRETESIVPRSFADWGEYAMLSIAPLHWWELEFPAKDGFNKRLAFNWLMRMRAKRGFFDPERIRGRGAWRDAGRFVFHFGHKLWVDGAIMDLGKIGSAYVYEQGRHLELPDAEPLANDGGRLIYDTFQAFHWSQNASAILLAGWCALATVAGALKWRPHVWITGGAGTGKTTLLREINWLMAGTALFAQGNSTEAGIRQALRIDSRGVIFDESEQNNDREALRVQNILSLIRQSSTESEAVTYKGSQGGDAMNFVIRSMFCLGSIQVGLKQQADIERVSVLTLRPKKDRSNELTAAEDWKRISGAIASLRADPDLPSKLLHRSLKLLPITAQNVIVFAQAAAEKFGSQRDGDQYGTLLAGAWSLVSTKVATLDEARAMIARHDWSDYLEGSETDESEKALATLMQKLIRVVGQDVSVFELIQRAALVECDLRDINSKEAAAILSRHGIRIEWGGSPTRATSVVVADSHSELKRLMEGTSFATDLKGQLRRIPGASKTDKKLRFGSVGVFATRIPIERVSDGPPEPLSTPVPDNEDFDEIDFGTAAA